MGALTFGVIMRLYLPPIFICLLLLTSGCEEKDEVAVVRGIALELVEKAEKHDVSAMLAYATGDFLAYPGAHDVRSARQVLFLTFRRYGSFDIVHPRFKVRLNDTKNGAEVGAPFIILRDGQTLEGASIEALLDDPVAWADAITEAAGEPYYVELTFTKTPDGWRVRRADVTRFSARGGP